MSGGYWFKSALFDIEAGEDEEINPGIFGRQLARWLKTKLEGQGYVVEDIIATLRGILESEPAIELVREP